jgi:hypothetical protein
MAGDSTGVVHAEQCEQNVSPLKVTMLIAAHCTALQSGLIAEMTDGPMQGFPGTLRHAIPSFKMDWLSSAPKSQHIPWTNRKAAPEAVYPLRCNYCPLQDCFY